MAAVINITDRALTTCLLPCTVELDDQKIAILFSKTHADKIAFAICGVNSVAVGYFFLTNTKVFPDKTAV